MSRYPVYQDRACIGTIVLTRSGTWIGIPTHDPRATTRAYPHSLDAERALVVSVLCYRRAARGVR